MSKDRDAAKEKWAVFRALWENDPTQDFAQIGRMAGCSKQSVSARAKREDWKRTPQTVQTLLQRAHISADKRSLARKPEKLDPPPGPDLVEEPEPVRPVPPESEDRIEAVVQGAVGDKLGEIINRHRDEWMGARRRIYEAVNGNDFNKAKLGKITAEAFRIIQDGERKAWGIDDVNRPDPDVSPFDESYKG